MWFFELIGILVTLGFFAILFMFFGVLQVLQAFIAICVFLFVLPFAALGAFFGGLIRQLKQ